MRNIVILNSLHFSYPLPILMRVSYNTLIVKQNTSDYYKYIYLFDIERKLSLVSTVLELFYENNGKSNLKLEGKDERKKKILLCRIFCPAKEDFVSCTFILLFLGC